MVMSPFPDRTTAAIPIFTDLASLRSWRASARSHAHSVGFVPTMGALHAGHLSLLQHSLAAHPLTLLSIFVNPTQFGPTEDLSTYPRTLAADLALLATLPHPPNSLALFLPSVQTMYPSGPAHGAFIELPSLAQHMEGRSRPSFFRGVATVVLKLFHATEPDAAYFGQKDIQQALLLRHLVRDTLLAHPSPEHVHVVPTARDPVDGLALSSRNAYLSPEERARAPALYAALQHARDAWIAGQPAHACLAAAHAHLARVTAEAAAAAVEIRTDYLALNDADGFEPIQDGVRGADAPGPVILSGAVWVGKTRLIDNVLLNEGGKVLG